MSKIKEVTQTYFMTALILLQSTQESGPSNALESTLIIFSFDRTELMLESDVRPQH